MKYKLTPLQVADIIVNNGLRGVANTISHYNVSESTYYKVLRGEYFQKKRLKKKKEYSKAYTNEEIERIVSRAYNKCLADTNYNKIQKLAKKIFKI